MALLKQLGIATAAGGLQGVTYSAVRSATDGENFDKVDATKEIAANAAAGGAAVTGGFLLSKAMDRRQRLLRSKFSASYSRFANFVITESIVGGIAGGTSGAIAGKAADLVINEVQERQRKRKKKLKNRKHLPESDN